MAVESPYLNQKRHAIFKRTDKYIIVAFLFTSEHGRLTFNIDKQMPEKKYFQQKFLLCKCHLTAGIPFGGMPLSLLDRFLQWPSLDGKMETFHHLF